MNFSFRDLLREATQPATLRSIPFILFGCLVAAVALVYFINPYGIVPGGAFGASIVIHAIFPSMVKKGLQRRIELICNSLSLEKDIDLFTSINIKFANTLPQNIYELSQTIKNLSPYLSSETLLNQLPFVENAKEELEKKKAEDEEITSSYDFTNIDNAGGDTDAKEE